MELDETGFHGGIILELSHLNDMQRLLLEARKAKRFLREIDRQLILTWPDRRRTPRELGAKDE
jgi:hypothetical protein